MIFQTSHAMSNVNMMIFEKHSMREKNVSNIANIKVYTGIHWSNLSS